MRSTIYFMIFVGVLNLSGCQTANQQSSISNVQKQAMQRDQEIQSALKSVAQAVSDKEMSEEELQGLAQQVQKDDEARSAVEAITDSVSQPPKKIWYCPQTGERFSANVKTCPGTNTPLKELK